MSEQKMNEGPTQKQKEFIEFLEKATNHWKIKTTMESIEFRILVNVAGYWE